MESFGCHSGAANAASEVRGLKYLASSSLFECFSFSTSLCFFFVQVSFGSNGTFLAVSSNSSARSWCFFRSFVIRTFPNPVSVRVYPLCLSKRLGGRALSRFSVKDSTFEATRSWEKCWSRLARYVNAHSLSYLFKLCRIVSLECLNDFVLFNCCFKVCSTFCCTSKSVISFQVLFVF